MIIDDYCACYTSGRCMVHSQTMVCYLCQQYFDCIDVNQRPCCQNGHGLPMTIDDVFNQPADLDSRDKVGMPAGYDGAWATWYFPNHKNYLGGISAHWDEHQICTLHLWTKDQLLIQSLPLNEHNAIFAWQWFCSQTSENLP